MPRLSPRLMSFIVVLVCVIALVPSLANAATLAPFQILTRTRNPIVWQGFGTCLMMTEDMPNGRICYYYDYKTRARMDVKAAMAGNWVPLGSAIKWLMYVGSYQARDRLMAHDVDHNIYSIAKFSPQNQVGCGFAGTDCFFGEYRAKRVADHYPVDLYKIHLYGGGGWEPVCISDSEKSQFAHDGNLLVYAAHYSFLDNRIMGLYFAGGPEFTIIRRAAKYPTVCGSLVAWVEKNGLGFNIVAMDISTGEVRTVGYTKANPPCAQAGRGAIFWEDARNVSTGLDIYGYDWATGKEFCVTKMAGAQVRLRVCDDLVTYVSGPKNYEILWGAKIVD